MGRDLQDSHSLFFKKDKKKFFLRAIVTLPHIKNTLRNFSKGIFLFPVFLRNNRPNQARDYLSVVLRFLCSPLLPISAYASARFRLPFIYVTTNMKIPPKNVNMFGVVKPQKAYGLFMPLILPSVIAPLTIALPLPESLFHAAALHAVYTKMPRTRLEGDSYSRLKDTVSL
jgi:hypothetical protein